MTKQISLLGIFVIAVVHVFGMDPDQLAQDSKKSIDMLSVALQNELTKNKKFTTKLDIYEGKWTDAILNYTQSIDAAKKNYIKCVIGNLSFNTGTLTDSLQDYIQSMDSAKKDYIQCIKDTISVNTGKWQNQDLLLLPQYIDAIKIFAFYPLWQYISQIDAAEEQLDQNLQKIVNWKNDHISK